MWENIIGEQIRRANRNLLVANLFLLGMMVLFFCGSFRPMYNQFVGPLTIDSQELVKLTGVPKQQRFWFNINNARLSPVIWRKYYVTRDKSTNAVRSQSVEACYQLMALKGGLLVVQSNGDRDPGLTNNLKGALVPLSAEVRQQIDKLGSGPLSKFTLPIMLDTTRFHTGEGYWPLFFIVPLSGLALWNLRKVMARREDFLLHPIAVQMKKYGDPRELAGLIGQEARDATEVFNTVGLTITKNWIVSRHPWGMDVHKLDDLVWVHGKVTSHSVNFVPVGKTQSMLFYFNDKTIYSISPSSGGSEQLLAALMQRAPAVIYGYSTELAATWSKNRQAMIDQVQKRKAELKEQAKANKRKENDGDAAS